MPDAEGVVQETSGDGGEASGGDLKGAGHVGQGVQYFGELAVWDEKQAADGVEEDAGVLPCLRGALALVGAEGET